MPRRTSKTPPKKVSIPRFLLVLLLVLAFEILLLWVGTWGSKLIDTYSSMISFTFLLQIATFCYYEKHGKRELPRLILDSAFVAFAVCIVSIPFVSVFSRGMSVGFCLAVIADSIFKCIFGMHRALGL
jgi:hypothetical protein